MKNSPTSKVQQGFKAKGLSFSTSDPNNIAVVKVGKNVLSSVFQAATFFMDSLTNSGMPRDALRCCLSLWRYSQSWGGVLLLRLAMIWSYLHDNQMLDPCVPHDLTMCAVCLDVPHGAVACIVSVPNLLSAWGGDRISVDVNYLTACKFNGFMKCILSYIPIKLDCAPLLYSTRPYEAYKFCYDVRTWLHHARSPSMLVYISHYSD